MGTKPAIDLKGARKRLKKLKFKKVRNGGKHEIWKNHKGVIVMISHGNQEIGPDLLKSIASQARLTVNEFLDVK